MGILSITTDLAGELNDNPRRVRIISTDNLAAVTTAGYLNAKTLLTNNIFPTDIIDMVYSYSSATNSGTYEVFIPSFSAGVITLALWANAGDVLLPVVSGNFAVFNGTTGQIKDGGYLPSNAAKTNVVMATAATVANHIMVSTDTAGTVGNLTGTAINDGNIQAGRSTIAGTLGSFPSAATSGELIIAAVTNSSGNFNTTVSNASAVAQSQVISIPDSGAATANFLLDKGTAATASIQKLSIGATPVAQVDPASCTITAAAGASNTATVTVQLKDGAGANMSRSIAFRVYASSAADGLTLASAASTGFSVASGGLSLQNGTAITTQISAMSSATGGCVLSLLDTGKQTSYLVLVLPSGNKISAQLSAGSYGA